MLLKLSVLIQRLDLAGELFLTVEAITDGAGKECLSILFIYYFILFYFIYS